MYLSSRPADQVIRHHGPQSFPTAATRIRRLSPQDSAGIEQHLLELDPISRNLRFNSGFGNAAVTSYVRALDLNAGVVLGAVEPGAPQIIGLGEAHPSGPGIVELGVSVLPRYRRRGLATILIALAIDTAFANGARSAELQFNPANQAMIHIARHVSARILGPGRAIVRA